MMRATKDRLRRGPRFWWMAGGLLALFVLSACEAEIDHFFNEDGSLTFQIALGDEIDEEEGESIDCNADDSEAEEAGFELQYVERSTRGAQTWCTQGIGMKSPRHLRSYYQSLNENGDFIRVNCLEVIDGHLIYDVELVIDEPLDPEEESLLWRVTAPGPIESTNADSQSDNTAVWNLTNRTGLVSLQVNAEDAMCATADFSLSLFADTATSGTAMIIAAEPSSDQADTEAILATLAEAGWAASANAGEITATRAWADADDLRELGRTLPFAEGSDFAVEATDDGGAEFEARLDLSFYESFWQGINPGIEDPSFRFSWTPPAGQTEVSGDWTDTAGPSFDWTVDTQGRIFNLSASSVPSEAGGDEGSTESADDTEEEEEYGVIERDGKLFLNARPGEVLQLTRADLPEWARGQIAVKSAYIATVGPPDTVAGGDPTVLIEGFAVARLGDPTQHGGVIVEASDRIFANGVEVAVVGSQTVNPMVDGVIPRVGGPILTTHGMSDEEIAALEEAMANREPLTAAEGRAIDRWRDLSDAYEFRKRRAVTLRQKYFVDQLKLELDAASFVVDQILVISHPAGTHSEYLRVAGKGSIILDEPLKNEYPAGSFVISLDDETADRVRESLTAETGGVSLPIVVAVVIAAAAAIAGAWMWKRRTGMRLTRV